MKSFDFVAHGNIGRETTITVRAMTISAAWRAAVKLLTGPTYYGRNGLYALELIGTA